MKIDDEYREKFPDELITLRENWIHNKRILEDIADTLDQIENIYSFFNDEDNMGEVFIRFKSYEEDEIELTVILPFFGRKLDHIQPETREKVIFEYNEYHYRIETLLRQFNGELKWEDGKERYEIKAYINLKFGDN